MAEPQRLVELCPQVVQRLAAALDAGAALEGQREGQKVQQILAGLEKLGRPLPAAVQEALNHLPLEFQGF